MSGRNHEITIKVSEEELEIIRKKAVEVGIPASTLLRILGLNADIKAITPTKTL